MNESVFVTTVEFPIAIYSNGTYQATDISLFALADQAASFCRSISPSRLEPSATSTVTFCVSWGRAPSMISRRALLGSVVPLVI